jgi:hypothetical protein
MKLDRHTPLPPTTGTLVLLTDRGADTTPPKTGFGFHTTLRLMVLPIRGFTEISLVIAWRPGRTQCFYAMMFGRTNSQTTVPRCSFNLSVTGVLFTCIHILVEYDGPNLSEFLCLHDFVSVVQWKGSTPNIPGHSRHYHAYNVQWPDITTTTNIHSMKTRDYGPR